MTESSLEHVDEESERHGKSDLGDKADEDKDLIDGKEFLSPSLPTVIIMPTRRTLNKGKIQGTFLCQVSSLFHFSYLIYIWVSLTRTGIWVSERPFFDRINTDGVIRIWI